MTREEANGILENWKLCHYTPSREAAEAVISALDPLEIISALRPVSWEQVEKMKKAPVEGEYDELYAPTYKCPECGFWNTGRGNFCRNCGCLHTDEAVDMVMERLNKLEETKK